MNKWTNKYPTPKEKNTKWWFYGWMYGKMDISYMEEPPELIIVDCTKTARGQHNYIANGHFFYTSEAIGVFKKFEPPETPTVDELKKMMK